MNDIQGALKSEISSHGMTPPDYFEPGKLTRFSDNGGKNQNGWCSFHLNSDGSAGAAFGNWKDVNQKWFHRPDGKPLSKEQRELFVLQIREAQEKANQEREAQYKKSALKAQNLWNKAQTVDSNHGYLVKKQIESYGLKQSGKAILVPVLDEKGEICSLQQILPDGSKKFFPGGKAKGGSFVIGDIQKDSTCYIGEGYATMASIYNATDKPCVVAFNSGNLKRVTETIRALYPDKKIIIAADNDLETKEKIGTNPGVKAGEEAANAIGAELCLCPIDSDFNDLQQAQGINAVKQALETITKPEQIQIYREPEALPVELLPVAPFDCALLPEGLRPWVEDIVERMQCPPDFVAVGVMTALAAVIGRKVGIRPQARTDWTVVCNLWALVVGRPGVLKSPALESGLSPLKRLIATANERYRDDEGTYQLAALAAKLKREDGEKRAKILLKKDPKADVLTVLAVDEVPAPTLKRYKANDSTPASLGELLRQNPNGLLVFRDEIVSLLKNLDRDGQDEGRGFYLTAWNGDSPYTFDRIGRGLNLHIPALCISLLGGTQPGRLSEYIRHAVKGGSADDGLIQRFGLLVWPDTSGQWKNVDRWPDNTAKNNALGVFDYLDRFDPIQIGAEQDTDIDGAPDGIPFLRFDLRGSELFLEWRTDLEKRLRGELHPAFESHLAKYRKLIPSLALIIHLADGGSGPVSERATLQALAWGEYLETHAQRAYGSVSQPEIGVAKAILARIKKGDLKTPFSSRDVWRPGWAKLSDREQVADALQMLEDYNWITREKIGNTGGRPATVFHTNERGV